MANKKSFELNPIPINANPLAELHNEEPVVAKTPLLPKTSVLEPNPEEENRINQNFYVKKKYIRLIDTGKLEEKFRSKADFLDHVFESYFKGKPYNK